MFLSGNAKSTRPRSSKADAIIALSFSLIGLYLRFNCFATRTLGADEQFSVANATGPLPPFWHKVSVGTLLSFPGHYLSLWPLGQIFGKNKWALAVPHIIVAAIGFYLLYLICRRSFRSPFATAVTFAVTAFNSQLIFHSFELRPYGVLASVALACLYLWPVILEKGETLSPRAKFLTGVFFTLTVFYHAYGILIIFVCLLYALLAGRSAKNLRHLWANIKFLLPFVPLSAAIFLWYGTGHGGNIKAQNLHLGIYTFQYIANPLLDPVAFLKSVVGNLVGERVLYPLLAGLVIAFLRPHPERFAQIGFFLIVIVFPILVIFHMDLQSNYWFVQRQFIWCVPLFAYLLGWCWDSVLAGPSVRK